MDNKILEGNRLIAEFMGLELEETMSGKMVYARHELKNPNKLNDCQTEYYEAEELLFHFSWDWLIEVIQTCKERQVFGGQGLINNIERRLLEFDLLATFGNVVSYIEFYNVKAKAHDSH